MIMITVYEETLQNNSNNNSKDNEKEYFKIRVIINPKRETNNNKKISLWSLWNSSRRNQIFPPLGNSWFSRVREETLLANWNETEWNINTTMWKTWLGFLFFSSFRSRCCCLRSVAGLLMLNEWRSDNDKGNWG